MTEFKFLGFEGGTTALPDEVLAKINQSLEGKFREALLRIGEDVLKQLMLNYRQSAGSDDQLGKKMATWLEAREMTVDDLIEAYPEHIVLDFIDDRVVIQADTKEWELVAQALEYGTRTSPPVPHWDRTKRLYMKTRQTFVQRVLKEELAT